MIPLEFPPGVTNLASKNARTVNWRESHLIRWEDGGTMEPIKGWERLNLGPWPSPLRKMHRWQANNGNIYTAYLCETNVFVEFSGAVVEITPTGGMVPTPVNNGGYGDAAYGTDLYGTPRPGLSRLGLYTPMFSMDNWGEELRVMTSSDGRYLGWSPSAAPGTLLTAVTGAPTGNRAFIITPERHAMLFGQNSVDKFAWSDEEDDTNWAYADLLSRAGFYDVSPKSPIVTQQLFSEGIIFFTPIMTYLIEWIGLPYTYSYRPLGEASVPVSPASICATPRGVIWPAVNGWWHYDGSSIKPIPCPIWDFIKEKMNVSVTRFTGVCVHVENEGEVWWFYADNTDGTLKNRRFAAYNYRNETWTMGELSRTCGYVYANDTSPIMSDGINVWKHETGYSYQGADLPWIESFNLNPNGGENFFTVKRLLPDIKKNADAVAFRMVKTNDRAGYTPETMSPRRQKNEFGYVDIRETARDMRLRIEMVANKDWGTIGPILFDSTLRGKK
jgi:hypothetical protein